MQRAGHRPITSERAATAGSPATPGGPNSLFTRATPGGGGGSKSPGVALRKGNERYPTRLSFYNVPPTQEITLWQFETWAIDRLRVLADIESSQARNRTYEETRDLVKTTSRTYLPLNAHTAKEKPLQHERERDHVSHFVLRLAFSRSEELRRRFAKAETMLFRLRWEEDDSIERAEFVASLNIEWEHLKAVNSWAATNFKDEHFYKVHWTKVLDLVEKRKVLLLNGQAYVPSREQSALVVSEFHNNLLAALEQTARALPRLNEDDRLVPVLEHLSMGFMAGISSDYQGQAGSGIGAELGEALRAEMVENLVRQHAPMCMRHLQETLTEKKHLKHFGRLQYNLFLKEMGLPIEEALVFWRRSFAGMTDDKFNKEHKYNIRHGYGLEGRRMNYPAKSCARILTQDQPGPQDSHGCPFRHFSPQNLSAGLSSLYNIPASEQAEILTAVKAGHYHVGCTRLFELTHKKVGVKRGGGVDGKGESVSHPNRYFERSFGLSREGMEVDEEQEVKEEGEKRDPGENYVPSVPKWGKTSVLGEDGKVEGEIGDEELDALVGEQQGGGDKMEVDDGIDDDAEAEARLLDAMYAVTA
ncbi:unnamed protein product [Tilletia controversa]|nr:unnamed protein product [Tilletia caries]CAD6924899.1 unnamed protein product [Tilletia controversa]